MSGEAERGKEIREAVRKRYGAIAGAGASGCGCGSGCGCDDGEDAAAALSRTVGYSEDELSGAPEGANLGLGCGNPVALASLRPGEVVVDLGSGAGFDVFLAAERVGPEGRVIGVDMTPEMVERARENAAEGGYGNVQFRLGEIEALPVGDAVADAIISNCVINLSADRPAVFREAHRVLRPGGRLMISDLVTAVPVPDALRSVMELFVSCLPVERDRYLEEIRAAGFEDVEVEEETVYPAEAMLETPEVREGLSRMAVPAARAAEVVRAVRSARIRGVRPG